MRERRSMCKPSMQKLSAVQQPRIQHWAMVVCSGCVSEPGLLGVGRLASGGFDRKEGQLDTVLRMWIATADVHFEWFATGRGGDAAGGRDRRR